jgi:hypothetical protein
MANGDTLKGIFEQDPHALPDGRIIGAAHFQPGLIASPIYTDDPSGIHGWIRTSFTNLSISGGVSRELEPSWFYRSDGSVVMVFRDQNNTYRRLASVSVNRGPNWSTAVVTDMPDSRAKQSAGNLPDSTAYMVGNPVTNKTRIPLVVTLSRDGKVFDKAYVLRQGGNDLQALRYTGTSKTLGYSYPKSMVWQGYLYITYATNKEDVEYTRVPITSLTYNNLTSVHNSHSLSEIPKGWTLYQNYPNPFNPTTTIRFSIPKYSQVTLDVYSLIGLRVTTLTDSIFATGDHQIEWNAEKYASGTYLLRFTANPLEGTDRKVITLVKEMMLVK